MQPRSSSGREESEERERERAPLSRMARPRRKKQMPPKVTPPVGAPAYWSEASLMDCLREQCVASLLNTERPLGGGVTPW